MKSRVVTVSAIAAGLISILLAAGIYFQFADLFALILASACVIMPLYIKSYKGAFLSYLAGGILGLVFGWFNFVYSFVFPAYFVFFGLYPIIYSLLKDKKINKYILYSVGITWCVAAFYGIYFYYTLVMGLEFADLPDFLNWFNERIIYVIGVFGIAFYFVYDRYLTVVRTLCCRYLDKIIK